MIEDNNNDELLFHRHCQATVLSAYGIGGQGATWGIINDLNLLNIEKILPIWRTYFSDNYNNITEDLAAILELIDFIVGKQKEKNYKIKFTNNNGDSIGLEQELESDTIFTGFGRNIELTVNNQTLQFNTMLANSGGQDKLSVTIPETTLTPGDLVFIVENKTSDETNYDVSVKNNIPKDYVGPIGINKDRELVEYTPPPPLPPEVGLTQKMFNQLWPVGSIYISVNSYPPFQGIPNVVCTWEQLLTGRALWNVPTDSTDLGNAINGVLPKHYHSVSFSDVYAKPSKRWIDRSSHEDWGQAQTIVANTYNTKLDSSVKSTVTVGNNLRPPSIAVTMWKRIS